MTATDNTRPWLTIVTVTYRCGELVLSCLDALAADGLLGDHADPGVEVIVVDSDSGDGTPDLVARAYPQATLLRQNHNVGFARGCNIGIKHGNGHKVLLLNPDAVVPPGAIAKLVAEMERYPRTAAVGPQLTCESGSAQIGTQCFPTLRSEFARHCMPIAKRLGITELGNEQPNRAGTVDWISGACMLLNAKALDELGLLDEGFFLYYEETDWCRRARQSGWNVRFCPDVRVTHIGGQSVAESGQQTLSGLSAEHFRSSRRRYFRKHYGLAVSLAVEAVHGARQLVRSAKMAAGMTVGGW